MRSDLEHISNRMFFAAIAVEDNQDDLKIAIAAEGGVMDSVASSVKEYAQSLYDPQRPVASVVSFLGAGLLYSMGFSKVSFLYTVAEALGFDWKGFWSSVGSAVRSLVVTIKRQAFPPTEQEIDAKIKSIVSTQIQANMNGEVDEDKLRHLSKSGTDADNAKDLIKFADKVQVSRNLTKESSWTPGVLKAKFAKFFTKTFSWLIKIALTSTVLNVGAASAKGVADHYKDNAEQKQQENKNAPIYKLKISPTVPKDFFTFHRNDLSNAWIEKGRIESVEALLQYWVLQTYPQLTENFNKIKQSTAFNNVLNQFKQRNRLAGGLSIISIPRPYERKVDVVSAIVNGFLNEE